LGNSSIINPVNIDQPKPRSFVKIAFTSPLKSIELSSPALVFILLTSISDGV